MKDGPRSRDERPQMNDTQVEYFTLSTLSVYRSLFLSSFLYVLDHKLGLSKRNPHVRF